MTDEEKKVRAPNRQEAKTVKVRAADRAEAKTEKKVRALVRDDAKTQPRVQVIASRAVEIRAAQTVQREIGAPVVALEIHQCTDERSMFRCRACNLVHCAECNPHRAS